MGEDMNDSKHCALYYYCSNYHTGENSWQYEVLSKSHYTPGPCHSDILDSEDFAAIQYYQHLLRLFEPNVCNIDLVSYEVGSEGIIDFWSHTYSITISVNGDWFSATDLARDVYEQVQRCDWGYQVDLADIFSCLGSFHYPLSVEVDNDTDEEETELLWLGFDWYNEPEEPVDTCNGCIYFTGESALRCAVNPLSTERCIEYQTA